MNDWDAVQKAARESTEVSGREDIWRTEESAWKRAVERALEERIDQFIQELSGNLSVSREWRRFEGHNWLLVIIGKKPMNVAGPDAVAEIRLEGGKHYFLKNPPMGVWKNTFTLAALLDQLVAMAAEVVSDPQAGTLPAIVGKSYVAYLDGKTSRLKWEGWFSNAYGLIGLLVGVACFAGCWYLLADAFGFLGKAFGWIPAAIVGLVVGLLWGLILIALLLLYVYQIR